MGSPVWIMIIFFIFLSLSLFLETMSKFALVELKNDSEVGEVEPWVRNQKKISPFDVKDYMFDDNMAKEIFSELFEEPELLKALLPKTVDEASTMMGKILPGLKNIKGDLNKTFDNFMPVIKHFPLILKRLSPTLKHFLKIVVARQKPSKKDFLTWGHSLYTKLGPIVRELAKAAKKSPIKKVYRNKLGKMMKTAAKKYLTGEILDKFLTLITFLEGTLKHLMELRDIAVNALE